MRTRAYFVRHAQPQYRHKDDRTRPLSAEGISDSELVTKALKDKVIDAFYCSSYKRSPDTIRGAAAYYGLDIWTDERLREREAGKSGNPFPMFQKRWAGFRYHEDGGESHCGGSEAEHRRITENLSRKRRETHGDQNPRRRLMLHHPVLSALVQVLGFSARHRLDALYGGIGF
ncbi:MAG: histidine phosphatase family protein [Oscillibacter sp.]|jgi:broad specificity phosphatase PhoE|nr:histidine phosphatase family protein [Oscillibacter sp.]